MGDLGLSFIPIFEGWELEGGKKGAISAPGGNIYMPGASGRLRKSRLREKKAIPQRRGVKRSVRLPGFSVKGKGKGKELGKCRAEEGEVRNTGKGTSQGKGNVFDACVSRGGKKSCALCQVCLLGSEGKRYVVCGKAHTNLGQGGERGTNTTKWPQGSARRESAFFPKRSASRRYGGGKNGSP